MDDHDHHEIKEKEDVHGLEREITEEEGEFCFKKYFLLWMELKKYFLQSF